MTPTRRSTARVAAVALVLGVAAAGCGGGDGGAGGLSELTADRRRMPSCGAYDAPPDGFRPDSPAEGRTARECFLSAFREGRESELSITVSSIEGDPITTIFRVLGPDDLELFVDASADRFSAVKAYHQRCTTLAEEGAGLAAGGCTTLSEE